MINLTYSEAHIFLSHLESAAHKLETYGELGEDADGVCASVAAEVRREVINPLRRILELPLAEIEAVCRQIAGEGGQAP